VREFAITYHVPISRAGTVRVRLWIERLGTTSLSYAFGFLSDDETVVYAEGRRVQVRLDPAVVDHVEVPGRDADVGVPEPVAHEAAPDGA